MQEGANMRLKPAVFKTTVVATTLLATGLITVLPAQVQPNHQPPPPHYRVIDLGQVGPNGQPFVVTNTGLVGGVVQNGNTVHAAIWFLGRMVDLDTPGLKGPNSMAFGMNQWGQTVGEAQTNHPDPKGEDFCGFTALGLQSSGTTCLPFVWQNGVMNALPTLGGSNGFADQINSLGEVAGTAENNTLDSTCPSGGPQKLQFKPVVWQNGGIHGLPTYSGDPDGNAHAINDLAQVAGESGVCAAFNPIWLTNLQPLHALLWEDGKVINLGTLGGTGHGNGISALNLNNRGQVIGFSDLKGDAAFHGFVWNQGSGMQDLGTVPGDVNSAAIGINDAGQIVGVSLDASFNPRAFLRLDQNLIDLNTLVPGNSPLYLATACSINAAGEIIGIAFDSTGNLHGYMAVP
jgi:probable HAF family extracellular repeat protein